MLIISVPWHDMDKAGGHQGVVQSERFMGCTESGQSRANQGSPGFACNPDLNHAQMATLEVKNGVGSIGRQDR